MKNVNIVLFLCCQLITSVCYPQMRCNDNYITVFKSSKVCTPEGNDWQLVFEDNFDGSTIDIGKWQLPYISGYGANQEYNTANNLVLSNGYLNIVAKKESIAALAIPYKGHGEILSDGLPNYRWYDYSSSNIWSKEIFSYGKYEIMCKLAKGKGFWPAAWMFGQISPKRNEIDIFEFWNEKIGGEYWSALSSKVPRTDAHYEYNNPNEDFNCQIAHYDIDNLVDYSSGFHKFSMIWDPYKIQWYIDDVLIRTKTKYFNTSGNPVYHCSDMVLNNSYFQDRSFPNEPFLNLIIGFGIQSGNDGPDEGTIFPQSLVVDYIRYYQQTNCEGNVDLNTDVIPLLSDENYLISGENVTATGNIPSSSQARVLRASKQIVLKDGFTVQGGANYFKASIVSCGNYRIGNIKDENISYKRKAVDTTYSLDGFEKRFNGKTHPIIYPNPSYGLFNIEMISEESIFKIEVNNSIGETILEQSVLNSGNAIIDLTNQPSGIYFVKIIDNSGGLKFFNKIVVTK